MATIKYDISDTDLDDAIAGSGYEGDPPKPGVYKSKIVEVNPGFSKDDDGKEDKSRPRLEVVVEITGNAKGGETEFKGARIWDYVSFSKAAEWKLAQFLYAIGEVAPGKKKRKGTLDPDKIKGTEIKIRVKTEKQEGFEPRPKVGGMWPWEGDEDDTSSGLDDDELDDELEDDDAEEADVPDEDTIRKMKVAGLKELAEEHDVTIKGMKKPEVIEALIEALHGGEDDDEEEELLDDDDEEELEDDESEYTADQIREMEVSELKELAKEQGVSLKGMKKSQAVSALIDSLGLSDDEDDDDVPF